MHVALPLAVAGFACLSALASAAAPPSSAPTTGPAPVAERLRDHLAPHPRSFLDDAGARALLARATTASVLASCASA